MVMSCGRNLASEVTLPEDVDVAYAELTAIPGDELRQAEIVKPDGASKGLLLDERNLHVQIAVRRGQGTPVYQTLLFTKVRGQNKVVYKGQIKLPTAGTGDVYEMSGIILNQAGAGGKVFTTLVGGSGHIVGTTQASALVVPVAHQGTDRKVVHQMPYLAPWTRLSLSADKKRINPIVLPFRPSGTLLRLAIRNELSEARSIKTIKISTNAFFRKWEYDLANVTGGNLEQGRVPNLAAWSHDFGIAPITIQPNTTSGWYYLWVMPRKAGAGLTTSIDVVDARDGSVYYAFKTTAPLKMRGVSVLLKLRGSDITGDFSGSDDAGSWEETY